MFCLYLHLIDKLAENWTTFLSCLPFSESFFFHKFAVILVLFYKQFAFLNFPEQFVGIQFTC